MAKGEINDYEAQRLANIERNKALLLSLGLDEFRVPDAPAKPKSTPKSKAKPKNRATKRKIADDMADDNETTAINSDSTSPAPARSSKRAKVTIAEDADEDSSVQGARRSSRRVARVSYANDGVVAAQAKARSLSPEVSDEFDDDDDDEDEEVEEDEDEGSEKPRRKRSQGRKRKTPRNDGEKLRNNPKMGKRLHDPYVVCVLCPFSCFFKTTPLEMYL